MIHICADEREPIGRPPVVRAQVLACMARLKRARVARVVEETGCKPISVQHVLRKAAAAGELGITRHGRYFVYEVRNG